MNVIAPRGQDSIAQGTSPGSSERCTRKPQRGEIPNWWISVAQSFADVFRNVAYTFLSSLFLFGCGNEPKTPETTPAAATANPDPRQASEKEQPLVALRGNGRLRIAAASDLKFALDEVRVEFERIHPGSAVTVTYGSSGNFFAQLANEAPFDLFLSADIDYARRLVEQGQGAPHSDFAYARGHVVIWIPKGSPHLVQQPSFAFMQEERVQKLAIANPKTAPYGRAAVAALKSLGVYEAVEPKLVYGENVAQAAQMVESGAADAGIIALSLAVSPAMRDQGRYWQVPDGAHPPLVQGGVVLRWAQDAGLALEFRDFLLSAGGASILRQFGFDDP